MDALFTLQPWTSRCGITMFKPCLKSQFTHRRRLCLHIVQKHPLRVTKRRTGIVRGCSSLNISVHVIWSPSFIRGEWIEIASFPPSSTPSEMVNFHEHVSIVARSHEINNVFTSNALRRSKVLSHIQMAGLLANRKGR
jgi:hypothetical protein